MQHLNQYELSLVYGGCSIVNFLLNKNKYDTVSISLPAVPPDSPNIIVNSGSISCACAVYCTGQWNSNIQPGTWKTCVGYGAIFSIKPSSACNATNYECAGSVVYPGEFPS
jgi:hypothetical protein